MLLVVVDDFNVESIGAAPDEANPELVIDSDAVLAFSIAFQCFKMISARDRQIGKTCCPVQDGELS